MSRFPNFSSGLRRFLGYLLKNLLPEENLPHHLELYDQDEDDTEFTEDFTRYPVTEKQPTVYEDRFWTDWALGERIAFITAIFLGVLVVWMLYLLVVNLELPSGK